MEHFNMTPEAGDDFENGLEKALNLAQLKAFAEGRRLCVADAATGEREARNAKLEKGELRKFRRVFRRMTGLAP